MKIVVLLWATIMFMVACGGKSQTYSSSQPSGERSESKSSNKTSTPKQGGEVIYLTTQDFIDKIFDYRTNKQWKFKGSRPCVIDFYADWCRPCKMVAPIMQELAVEYAGKIDFYKVNTDKERELAAVFGIQSIPSILFCPLNDKPVMAIGAYPKEEYVRMIEEVFYSKK
ncbi:MAG: thioredoxin [Bacteroidales bacterium]|nr:thioredoxin [Bacteroidales bacterium]